MPIWVEPSVQLAYINVGTEFLHGGRRYMLIRHNVHNVEIERVFWFDRLVMSFADRVREIRERIRRIKADRTESILGPVVRVTDTPNGDTGRDQPQRQDRGEEGRPS